MDRATVTRTLCLNCGNCCNGVLFKDVELQSADNPCRLAAAGLTVRALDSSTKLPQPCRALGPDLRCRIYEERPVRCLQFECALFKEVLAGRVELPAALRTVRGAILRANKVRKLLVQAGETDASKPLHLRFRRVQRRYETGTLETVGPGAADAYAELTRTVHSLNVFLETRFYPGRSSG